MKIEVDWKNGTYSKEKEGYILSYILDENEYIERLNIVNRDIDETKKVIDYHTQKLQLLEQERQQLEQLQVR